MAKKLYIPLVIAIAFVVTVAPGAHSQMLNPYLPQNAVVAQPPTPYYLRAIPKFESRTFYDPCPTCGPVAAQFPDVPPVQQRFPGPFGILVPVP